MRDFHQKSPECYLFPGQFQQRRFVIWVIAQDLHGLKDIEIMYEWNESGHVCKTFPTKKYLDINLSYQYHRTRVRWISL